MKCDLGGSLNHIVFHSLLNSRADLTKLYRLSSNIRMF